MNRVIAAVPLAVLLASVLKISAVPVRMGVETLISPPSESTEVWTEVSLDETFFLDDGTNRFIFPSGATGSNLRVFYEIAGKTFHEEFQFDGEGGRTIHFERLGAENMWERITPTFSTKSFVVPSPFGDPVFFETTELNYNSSSSKDLFRLVHESGALLPSPFIISVTSVTASAGTLTQDEPLPVLGYSTSSLSVASGIVSLTIVFESDPGVFDINFSPLTAYERNLGISGSGISTNVPIENAADYDLFVAGFNSSNITDYIGGLNFSVNEDLSILTLTLQFYTGGTESGELIVKPRVLVNDPNGSGTAPTPISHTIRIN